MKDGCLNDIHYSDSYETEKKNSDKKIDCCFIIRRTGAWVSTKKKNKKNDKKKMYKKCQKTAKINQTIYIITSKMERVREKKNNKNNNK